MNNSSKIIDILKLCINDKNDIVLQLFNSLSDSIIKEELIQLQNRIDNIQKCYNKSKLDIIYWND